VLFVYSLLLAAALVLIQCLIGGTRLVYSFPPYAIAGLAAVLSVISIKRPISKPSGICVGSALLLTGYVVARAWFSPNAYLARTDAFMVVGCLVVYLLTALYLNESRHRYLILGALFAVAAVHLGVGAIQFKTGEEFMLFDFNGGGYGSRASGMLICPNHLAGFLEALALLALSMTIWSRCRFFIKLVTGYVALMCLMGVAITGSRGGYLSLLCGLFVFAALSLWIVRIRDKRRFLLLLFVTVLALAALIGGAVELMTKSSAIRSRLTRIGTASEDVRKYNWLATIDQFKISPLLGTGSGTHLYYGRLFRRSQIQSDPQHSHGDYLELLAEYGVAGGLLVGLFLFVHIRGGLKTARQVTLRRLCNVAGPPTGPARSDTLAITLGALSAVAAILAHSVVDFNMHIPGNALLFAFLFGMLASPGVEYPEEIRLFSREVLLRGALAGMGVALIAVIGTQYEGEQLANRARLAMGAADYTKSIRLAERAIAKDPLNPNAYFYKGESLRALAANMSNYALREHYFQQASAAYTDGLKVFPENEDFWVRLGQCMDGSFQFAEAEEAYLNAIKNDPNLGILYAYYAAHLRLTGDLEGAAKCDAAARGLGAEGIPEIGMGEVPSLLKMRPSDEPK